MRVVLVLLLATLLLAGCKREAQEAAAQAKGAAAEAQRAAKEAADKARAAASNAGDSARQGLDNAGQSLREITAGDQLDGVLVSTAGTALSVRPGSGPVQTLHTDDRTRWIFHGSAAGKDGFGTGAPVRVTYIVRDGQRVATQVEAMPR